MKAATVLAQLGHYTDPVTGGLAPAIHPSVTHVGYRTTSVASPNHTIEAASEYARSWNAGTVLVESILMQLESGQAAAAFTAASAAAQALLAALHPGDHILLDAGCYYEFGSIIARFCRRWHIELTLADLCDEIALRTAMRPGRTKLVWAECPSNPVWRIPDIGVIARLAHEAGARLLVDATVATPLLCQPLKHGADLVLHSATKYLNGHGDVLAGALVSAHDDADWQEIVSARVAHGSILPPFEAWLLLRGLRSLSPRMELASRSAMQIATALAQHPGVATVHYPGLPSDPSHALALRQFTGGFGAMVSFCVNGNSAEALAVRDRAKLFRRSTSLGSTESLIEHRLSTEGPTSSCSPTLIRLSVGLECVDDLLEDLAQALAELPACGQWDRMRPDGASDHHPRPSARPGTQAPRFS